jgi:hypothetical protein
MILTLPANDRGDAVNRLAAVLLAALPGKRVKVEVKEYRKDRSNPQCRYLNGVAYKLLSDATGYERDDISEYLCIQFFGGRAKRVPGKRTVTVPLRTTTTDADGRRSVLTTQEFADYVAFVQRFGAQHGVFIPDPEES